MSIPDNSIEIKRYTHIKIIIVICLVALASFGLGRLSAFKEQRMPVRIESVPRDALQASIINTSPSLETVQGVHTSVKESAAGAPSGEVVGSKNGSKYHFPWCSGAQRISELNIVRFESIEHARASGYTPAANCKGLE